jgi:hypothetical protein
MTAEGESLMNNLSEPKSLPSEARPGNASLSLRESKEVSPKTPFEKLFLLLLGGVGAITGVMFLVLAAVFHSALLPAIVLAELGAVLLTISTLHFAYEHILRHLYEVTMLKTFEDAFQRTLREPKNFKTVIAVARKDYKAYESFIRHGLISLHHPSIKPTTLYNYLSESSSIRILKTWFPEDNLLEKGLENALQKNTTSIEMLLCHPESPLLSMRSISAGENKGEGAHKVVRALQLLHRWRYVEMTGYFDDDERCNCKIGLYKTWPGCPIIWCDNVMFLGFYFLGNPSPKNPWIEVNPDSDLGVILNNQFKLLWEHKETHRFKSGEELGHWLATLESEENKDMAIIGEANTGKEGEIRSNRGNRG